MANCVFAEKVRHLTGMRKLSRNRQKPVATEGKGGEYLKPEDA